MNHINKMILLKIIFGFVFIMNGGNGNVDTIDSYLTNSNMN